MTRARGILITFSGVDCAGKSTQRDLLLQRLRASGNEVVQVYSRPGSTPGLRALKGALRRLAGKKKEASRHGVSPVPGRFPQRAASFGNPLARWLWLTTSLLDLVWLNGVRIRLWMARGRVVVCNRYLLDGLVDFRVNFPAARVEERWLGRLLRRVSPRPDAAFCLLIPAARSMERARAKARYHWETLEVLEQRRCEYLKLCDELAVPALDGGRPPDEIARFIEQRVAEALAPERLDGPRSVPASGVERSSRGTGVAAHLADLGD